MLKNIQFNNELCGSTIKVYDKSLDDSLLINLHRIFAEKSYRSFRSWDVISLRKRRVVSSWLLAFGMSIVFPLSRLRRQLSQRESQAPSQSTAPTALPEGRSVLPLSRLRRQLSQRESQVSLATHYTRRCIERYSYLFGIYKTKCFFIRVYKVCLSSSSNRTSFFRA